MNFREKYLASVTTKLQHKNSTLILAIVICEERYAPHSAKLQHKDSTLILAIVICEERYAPHSTDHLAMIIHH